MIKVNICTCTLLGLILQLVLNRDIKITIAHVHVTDSTSLSLFIYRDNMFIGLMFIFLTSISHEWLFIILHLGVLHTII